MVATAVLVLIWLFWPRRKKDTTYIIIRECEDDGD